MTNNQISQQEIEELMRKPGKCIGEILLSIIKCIKTSRGEEGLRRFEEEMEKLGHPLDLDNIKPLDWHPVGLIALGFIASRRAFNWGDKEIIELGKNLLSQSPLFKLFARYFVVPKRLFKEAPDYWAKNYTPEAGRLEANELNEKEKYLTIRILSFNAHPDFCLAFLGFFIRVLELSGKKNPTAKETKCQFKGDEYHEFLIKWE